MKKTYSSHVTLKMIADEVGVTHSTVSAVLNNRAAERRVGKKTQRLVLEAARRMNYQPNYLARGLLGKRTRTIGLLLPSSSCYPQYLLPQELSLRLDTEGYQTYLVDSFRDSVSILTSLAEMSSRRVDGVVLSIPNHLLSREIRQALNQFPIAILVSHEPLKRETLRAHIIYENILSGVEEMVDYLIKMGRRRPLLAVINELGNQYKISAFRNALSHHGLDSRNEAAVFNIPQLSQQDLCVHCLRQYESQNLAARDFDALFCTSDEGAAAAIKYLTQRGIRVPEDAAVVGLNNTPWTQVIQPSLASISWKHVDSCDLVVRRLSELLDDPSREPGCDELPTRFVWRESAGKKLET